MQFLEKVVAGRRTRILLLVLLAPSALLVKLNSSKTRLAIDFFQYWGVGKAQSFTWAPAEPLCRFDQL